MKRLAVVLAAGVVVGLGWLAGPGRASLYAPEDPALLLPIGSNGKPLALDHDGMKRRLVGIGNLLLPEKMPNGAANQDRLDYLKLLEKAKSVRNPTPEDTVALAVLHLRLGQAEKAIELLNPLTRGRRPSYFASVALGAAYASTGDWNEAISYHLTGLEIEMPAQVKGWTDTQRAWCRKLDGEMPSDSWVLHYYQIRKQESEVRKGASQAHLEKLSETEDVLPLFPLGKGGPAAAIHWVNDAGVYQPGQLAANERAKLPTDAVAIVEQLLLWYPQDTRLYWLLAELYAAAGNLRGADQFFDYCAGVRQYGNRKVMMEHRALVRSALPKEAPPAEVVLTTPKPPEESSSPPPAESSLITMRMIKYYFAAIGVVVLIAIIRGKLRRSGRG